MALAYRTFNYQDGRSVSRAVPMCECNSRRGYTGDVCLICKGAIPTQQEIDDYMRQMQINKEVEARNGN